MISYHTCPLATLGGKDTGGMNVYVRELTRQLGHMGIHVDVFTRSQDDHVPHVLHELGYGNRVVHVPAGPEHPAPKQELANYVPQFVEGVKYFACEKGIRYDVIHSHYWMSGIAAAALSDAWGGTPILHMFHTLGEMKNRIGQMMGQVVEGMPWLGTFHSIGVKVLRRHAEMVGLKPDFTILDVDDQIRLLKQILAAENIDEPYDLPPVMLVRRTGSSSRLSAATSGASTPA